MSVLKRLAAFVPPPDDTVGTLEAVPIPTVAPAPPPVARDAPAADLRPPRASRPRAPRRRVMPATDALLQTRDGGVDGRSLRRTGRTAMLSVKVRPELPEAMKRAAYEQGLTLGALMDEMWDAWERAR
jgi:hypothetical protein